jgi:tyramine---L-glutamate ligase
MSQEIEELRRARRRRVFVCEYLSAGGAGPDDDAALLAQGRSMRDAIVADLLGVPGVSVTVAHGERVAPARGAARPVLAQRGEALIDAVRRQSAAHDLAWIVAPESAGLLARLHDSVEAAAGAARWIGCDAASIAVASSKRATLERLARHGIATPLAFAQDATHWVVKPDDGAGAVATRRHAGHAAARADLERRRAAGASATLEPWVEGEALSLSLLCERGTAELLAVNRQHIALDAAGHVDFRGVAVNALAHDAARGPALRRLAAAVARALPGLAGYVGVDVAWHAARGPVAIEVNPRVTCAYVGLSEALGRNLARDVLGAHERRFAGDEVADARS